MAATLTAEAAPEVREARAAAGITQEELARSAEVSLAYVRKIEAGYEPCQRRSSPKFSRVLAVLGSPSTTTNGAPAKSAAVTDRRGDRRDEAG